MRRSVKSMMAATALGLALSGSAFGDPADDVLEIETDAGALTLVTSAPAPATAIGQAVYRTLGEGRWVVRVSGDGALGLERVSDDAVVALEEAPAVWNFDEVQSEVRDRVEAVGWREAVGAVLGGE